MKCVQCGSFNILDNGLCEICDSAEETEEVLDKEKLEDIKADEMYKWHKEEE